MCFTSFKASQVKEDSRTPRAGCRGKGQENGNYAIIEIIQVVVKIMVPFWVPHILGTAL